MYHSDDYERRRYWAVDWVVGATGHSVIQAETEEQALELAKQIGFFPTSENTDFGDALEIADCIEIEEDDFLCEKRKGRDLGEL